MSEMCFAALRGLHELTERIKGACVCRPIQQSADQSNCNEAGPLQSCSLGLRTNIRGVLPSKAILDIKGVLCV